MADCRMYLVHEKTGKRVCIATKLGCWDTSCCTNLSGTMDNFFNEVEKVCGIVPEDGFTIKVD